MELEMKVESSGTLLYRKINNNIEVLLVHASGESNKNADWSIPKGRLDEGETPEQAARRETLEETGVIAPEQLFSLGNVIYKNKKKVHCFCGKVDQTVIPTCASWEVDKAEFVNIDTAEKILHYAQKKFIKRLNDHVTSSSSLCG